MHGFEGFVSMGENFTVRREKGLPVTDSIVHESRGSMVLGGLIPDGSLAEDVSRVY